MRHVRRKAILSPLAAVIWIIAFSVGISGATIFFGGEGRTGDISLQKGLMAQWKMAGNAKDSTPYTNDGTVTGASLITDRKGTANQAYNFNGTTDVITVPSSSSLSPTTQITAGGWVYDPPLQNSQVHLSPEGKISNFQSNPNPPAGRKLENSYLTEEAKHRFHRELARQPIGTKKRISPNSVVTNLGDGKFRAEFSTLQATKADLSPIDSSWHKKDNQWVAGENLFSAQINDNKVHIVAVADQPFDPAQGKPQIKAGDDVTFSPQLYVGGKEYKAIGTPKLLASDPINKNYHNNVLEWDYGIAKRRLRIIEGYVQGSWVFAKNPRAEVRIKYNQSGKLALSLGGSSTAVEKGVTPLGVAVVNNDEEVVKAEQFVQVKSYPVSIGDVTSFTSMTADAGYWGTSATYTTARSTGTSFSSTATTATVGQFCQTNPPYACSSYTVYRGGLQWDTSTLSDTAVISAGVISLYPSSDNSTQDFTITIVGGSGLSDTPVTGDHNNLNSATTRTASYATASGWSGAAYKTFSGLDATGISEISKTGRTKFGVRSSLDISATAPTIAGEYVAFYTNEGGAGKEPKLDVTYTDYPTITTSAATSITATTATLNGNITYTGGDNPTVTVYWGDNDGGTTPGNWDNNSAPTSPAQPQGIAAFYKNATGLAPNTPYYFTAKAVNSVGTTWATTQAFTTTSDSSSVVIIGKNRSAYNLEIDSSLNLTGYISGSASSTYQITKAWHHVVMTYDGANIKIYVDGVLRVTTAKTGAIGTNSANLLMGSSMAGKLDDMRVYNRALGQNEITAWYDEYHNPGIAVSDLEKGLIGHWKFAGDTKDASPNGNNGTFVGETVVDGNCDSLTGWTVDNGGHGSTTISSGTILQTQNVGYSEYMYTYQTLNLVQGATYSYSFIGVNENVDGVAEAAFWVGTAKGDGSILTRNWGTSTSGTFSGTFVAGATNVLQLINFGAAGRVVQWNTITITGQLPISSKLTTDRKGTVNQALSFNGTSDYVTISTATSSPFRQSSAISYSFWVNMPSSGGGNAMGTAVSGGQGSGGVAVNQSGSAYFYWTPTNPNSDRNWGKTGLTFTANTWYHIVATMNFSGASAGKIYVNGVDQSATISTADVVNGAPTTSYNTSNGDDIGGRYINSQTYFNGKIDDARVYNRVLSPAEITSLYQEYHNPGIAVSDLQKGLIGQWKMDGNVRDATPNENNGSACSSGHTDNGNGTCTVSIAPAKDNYITSDPPSQNTNNNGTIFLMEDYSANKQRPILEFSLSGLPAGVTITSANLQLYYYFHVPDDSVWGDPVGKTTWAYKITRTDWSETQSTWLSYKTGSAWTAGGGDYVTSSPAGGSTTIPASYGWMTWSVLAIAQNAQTNSNPVEILIKFESETAPVGSIAGVYLYAREYSDSSLRPKLVVTYNKPSSPIILPTLTTDRKGAANQAYSFNGTGDYIGLTSAITTAKTQSGWFYFTQLAASKGNSNYLFNNFYQHYANNLLYFENTNDYINWTPTINTWYHLVLTYSNASDDSTATLYVNGVPYSVTQQAGSHAIGSISQISSSTANTAFKGLIDDVRIYNRALSQTEVTALYQSH